MSDYMVNLRGTDFLAAGIEADRLDELKFIYIVSSDFVRDYYMDAGKQKGFICSHGTVRITVSEGLYAEDDIVAEISPTHVDVDSEDGFHYEGFDPLDLSYDEKLHFLWEACRHNNLNYVPVVRIRYNGRTKFYLRDRAKTLFAEKKADCPRRSSEYSKVLNIYKQLYSSQIDISDEW